MTKYKYSTTIGEKDAAGVGRTLPISTKQAIEICNFIRGKNLERAKTMLDDVINKKIAVPFKRFTDGVGHRKGKIAGGRYPKKACGEILNLINSVQANSQFKGLSVPDLVVRHISAQKGANTLHYGRHGRNAKRTTIEVVLTETEAKKKEKKEEKGARKEEKQDKEVQKSMEETKETKKAEETKGQKSEEQKKEKPKSEKETKTEEAKGKE